MPQQFGIDACLAIKEAVPSNRIVMLTISDEESDLFEVEVLWLVARALGNRDIGQQLYISENTVKNHVRQHPGEAAAAHPHGGSDVRRAALDGRRRPAIRVTNWAPARSATSGTG
jgi:FixJ family two-component response regulator